MAADCRTTRVSVTVNSARVYCACKDIIAAISSAADNKEKRLIGAVQGNTSIWRNAPNRRCVFADPPAASPLPVLGQTGLTALPHEMSLLIAYQRRAFLIYKYGLGDVALVPISAWDNSKRARVLSVFGCRSYGCSVSL